MSDPSDVLKPAIDAVAEKLIADGLLDKEEWIKLGTSTQAQKQFTLDDLAAQTAGVECRKDHGVLDEIPGAYKDIDVVMENQKDLVKIVAQLKQIMCVKG